MVNHPHFNAFILGAQKAASSSLHFSLLSHPEVSSKREEITVFETPFYSQEVVKSELKEHLNLNLSAKIYMLKRANLLCDADAPSRLYQHNPNARLICVLRDPSARAVSAILHYMKSGVLPISTVDEAVERIFGGNDRGLSDIERTVREYGLYGKYIEGWLRYFNLEQFLVLKQKKMRNLEGSYREVCSFLDIDDSLPLPSLNESKTKASIDSMVRLRMHGTMNRLLRRPQGDSMFTTWRKPKTLFRGVSYLISAVDREVLSKCCHPSFELKASKVSLDCLGSFYASDLEKLESIAGINLRD